MENTKRLKIPDAYIVRHYIHFYTGQRAKIPDCPVKYRTPGNPSWNASIWRSAQYQVPFDAAAVQLSMEALAYKAESHQHRSGMTGQDWQKAHPSRRCRAGTATVTVRSPEGRHSGESGRLKRPCRRGSTVGDR